MKIELKNLDQIDPGQLAYFANDKRVCQYLRNSFPHPYTVSDAMQYIQFSIEHHQLDFAIIVDGICVGCIGATFQKDIYCQNCELGYWLGFEYWNKGIMSYVIPLMCEFIFNNFIVTKIYAVVFAENTASAHLLEKCGFNKEGYLKQHIFKNGYYYDAILYGLLGGQQ